VGALDALLGGAATVGQTALQVPQAVGGGALDILIGDRTNVPAGEQVKRSIEALLLSGDNPANLIAIHHQNAQRNAQNEAIVNSPDFRRTMSVQQTVKDLTPEEAFNATAELYGVHGYQPPMAREAVDAAPGGPSLPDRQNVPQLAPLSRQTQLKDIVQGTQLHAATQGDPLDQLLARYQLGKVNPPIGLQRDAAEQAVKGDNALGLTQRTVQWKDGSLSLTTRELSPEEQFFANEDRAKDAALYQNKYREAIGDPVRVGLAVNPSGGYSLMEMHDPAEEARLKAISTVTGRAEGENTKIGGGVTPAAVGKTGAEVKADTKLRKAGEEYDRQTAGFVQLLDKLESHLSVLPEKGGSIPGAVAGRGAALLSNALPQAFPEQQALTNAGDAAAVFITDLYGGKGSQSDKDVKLMIGQVPRMGVDSQITGREKLQMLRAAVASRRPGGAPSKTKAPATADDALNAAFLR
jgi:hypothetical protein